MNLIGPSYTLNNRRAAVQRAINYQLRMVEPGNEKSPATLEQVPGLVRTSILGTGEIRGAWWTGSRCFIVAGNTLWELLSNFGAVPRGTLSSSAGPVDFAQGLFQVVLVDGPNGYVFTLATNVFGQITDGDFYGSARVSFLDGKFIFIRPDTQQFYWSAGIDQATSYDALDFASAESQPDKLIGLVVNFRELLLMGEFTTEVWSPYPTETQVYQRNNGANMEVGLLAAHSLQRADNGVIWLGRDRNGQGMVWLAYDYRPQRVSSFAVEQALAESTDLTQARAFVFQRNGQTFYALNAPGLPTTWVFDVGTRQWHERAELVDGELAPWRPMVHVQAFGQNLMGDVNGIICKLDDTVNTYDGDPITRERVSPHNSTPGRLKGFFDYLRLDVTVGEVASGIDPQMELRYSNDGGFNWSNWVQQPLGQIGRFSQPVKWSRLGQGRDRVWHLRCTADCKASIQGVSIAATEGAI